MYKIYQNPNNFLEELLVVYVKTNRAWYYDVTDIKDHLRNLCHEGWEITDHTLSKSTLICTLDNLDDFSTLYPEYLL